MLTEKAANEKHIKTDTDLQERIERLNKLEQEWKQSIKETKAAKARY